MVRLESARLIFRDHERSDLEPYCEMESDPIYRRPQQVHPREELERSFTHTWLPRKEFGLLATVLKADGRYIGRTGLYPYRDEGVIVPNEGTLAFYLARSGTTSSCRPRLGEVPVSPVRPLACKLSLL